MEVLSVCTQLQKSQLEWVIKKEISGKLSDPDKKSSILHHLVVPLSKTDLRNTSKIGEGPFFRMKSLIS